MYISEVVSLCFKYVRTCVLAVSCVCSSPHEIVRFCINACLCKYDGQRICAPVTRSVCAFVNVLYLFSSLFRLLFM